MEKVGIWGQDWLQKIKPKRTMLIKWPKSVSLMIPLEMPLRELKSSDPSNVAMLVGSLQKTSLRVPFWEVQSWDPS